MKVPLPVIITREGKWFVAACPPLDIATQGRTEKEVKENMAELMDDHLKDPDTQKPVIKEPSCLSITNEEIAQSFTTFFNTMWKIAEK